MKIQFKLVPTLIMFGISLLLGYAFYAANSSEWQKWLMFALTAVELSVLLIGGFGIKYAERGGVNITIVSVIFVIIAIVIQFVSTIFAFNIAPYIITNGILVLLYVGIVYGLAKALNK